MEQSTRPRSSITFPVSDVERATERRPEVSYLEALTVALGKGGVLEAYSRDTKPLMIPRPHPAEALVHPFLNAANTAYDRHYPLTLSPDMIWLLIAQGFALHVNTNAEAMRDHFVSHEGKVELKVIRNEFVRGFAGNAWEGVFAEFSEKIAEHVGAQMYRLIVPQFSTTGIVEKAAFEITLMDAVQQYFEYHLFTRCGIPEISLEGTSEDWEAVRAGAAALADYDLEWWTTPLLPVLDAFAAASRGDIDLEFWQSLYKVNHHSGGPTINGHLVNLFPYLVTSDQQSRQVRRNPHLGWKAPLPNTAEANRYPPVGITLRQIPSSLSVAPFTWHYLGSKLPMEFVAGFIGVAQDAETLSLRPEIGWAVRERISPEPS